jgi:hypothetical protein
MGIMQKVIDIDVKSSRCSLQVNGKQIIKTRDGEWILYVLEIHMFRDSNSIQ